MGPKVPESFVRLGPDTKKGWKKFNPFEQEIGNGRKDSLLDTVNQTCTTYGSRAKCGPLKLLFWPVKPKVLFIHLALLDRNTIWIIKNTPVWALEYGKKKFGLYKQKKLPRAYENLNPALKTGSDNNWILYEICYSTAYKDYLISWSESIQMNLIKKFNAL